MGQDIRPKSLAEITNISNCLDYEIVVDSEDIPEAFSQKLSELINQGSILTDVNNKYDMITPKNIISTTSSTSRKGITKKASSTDITNKTSNKIISVQKIPDMFKCLNFNINNTNKNEYVNNVVNGNLNSINLYYHNKFNKNVTINGQLQVQFPNTVDVFAIYLLKLNEPIVMSVGSSFSVLLNGSNFKNNICSCRYVSGYLLEIGFNQRFLANNTYFLDFTINYNI